MSVNAGVPIYSKCEIQLFELSHQNSPKKNPDEVSDKHSEFLHERMCIRRRNHKRASEAPLRWFAIVGRNKKKYPGNKLKSEISVGNFRRVQYAVVKAI
jgi:hypothetical protein